MKKAFFGIALSLLCCSVATAGGPIQALILDSGSDFTHSVLNPLALPNPAELNGTANVDDDKNGYIDDLFGWNFVEASNLLVNLKNTPPTYDKVLKCMKLLGILQAYGKEGMSTEEFDYLYACYQDKKFWAWVSFAGGWAHGTHCAGIIATKNPDVKLKSVRHIPTGDAPARIALDAAVQIKHMMLHKTRRTGEPVPTAGQKVTIEQLSAYFAQLGESYAVKVKEEAAYLGSLAPHVMNCSFGTDNSNLIKVFKQNMVEEWGWVNPTDAEVQDVVNLFVAKALLPRDKALFGKCPNTLVFIAAGNSSEHLDPITTSPNDVPMTNKLVVAATQENKKLAAFSCYGKNKVDVAVPGVNIFATYPNNQMGYMSGTSMACPMAARFATLVLQEYDKLTPEELKKLLMGTVDKKDWLTEKVKSGGVINPNRAVYAAKLLTNGMALDAAIIEANKKVADMVIRTPFKVPNLKDKKVRELYFSAVF